MMPPRVCLLLLAAGFVFTACERQPSEEEVAKQEAAKQAAKATPAAAAKPGSWMYDQKQRTTTLEKKAH